MIVWTDGNYNNVALLAEGVDRNILAEGKAAGWWVALLAEGVDRNTPG